MTLDPLTVCNSCDAQTADPDDPRGYCADCIAETDGRYFLCCCCAGEFQDDRPQNPQRDTGYGTCPKCREWIDGRETDERARAATLDPQYA